MILARLVLIGTCVFASFNSLTAKDEAASKDKTEKPKEQDLIAVITTSMGTIEAKLFYKEVPVTVSNFVQLSRSGFYEKNMIFHRVIPKFMIQTGDPQGNGSGGPGYSFKDEFHPTLKHSKAGMLSMANSGANTNGSQFFITVAPTPHLDNKHSVFGEVTKGLDIAVKISEVATKGTTPVVPINITKLSIKGDWFKPVAVEKAVQESPEDIKKITQKLAESLAKSSGEALNLGKVMNVTFKDGRSSGEVTQALYSVDYSQEKGTQLVIVAKKAKTGGALNIVQYQFARSNGG